MTICSNGHDYRQFGFIDSEGTARCRQCRKESRREREYWRLVDRLMTFPNDLEALDVLKRFHWNEP